MWDLCSSRFQGPEDLIVAPPAHIVLRPTNLQQDYQLKVQIR